MDIFNISETPVLENVNSILEEGSKIKTVEQPKIKGNTRILKIMVGDVPFYHFSNTEFDNELASRNQSVVVGQKRFYLGLKNNSMHVRMRLKPLA
jgi:hypothetical protein